MQGLSIFAKNNHIHFSQAIQDPLAAFHLSETADFIQMIPYPPGIPLLCPGEKFHKEQVAHIRTLRAMGEKVIGVTPGGGVFVGK